MSALRSILPAIILALAAAGCSSTPDGVLSKSDMADLLVDINIGESVIEMNFREYDNDSVKKVLRQSILAEHGLSSDDYDRSINWYGHHIDVYQEVYEEVIARLEKRIAEEKVKGSAEEVLKPSEVTVQTSFDGDSVDIWTQPKVYAFSSSTASEYLTFTINRDANMKPGDVYIWSMSVLNNNRPIRWAIVASYGSTSSNSDFDIASSDGLALTVGDNAASDRHTLTLRTAADKIPSKVFGFVHVRSVGDERVMIGDISLVRRRHTDADNIPEPEITQSVDDDGSVTLRFDNNSETVSTQKTDGSTDVIIDKNLDRRERQSRIEDERLERENGTRDGATSTPQIRKDVKIEESRPMSRPSSAAPHSPATQEKHFRNNSLKRRQ